MDWNDFSTDPNTEVSTDSIRYNLVAGAGFDSLDAGTDGSMMGVNAGMFTVASGAAVDVYYAFGSGSSLTAAIASCDTAAVKYATLTSVEPLNNNIPTTSSLQQNYPNPFNPSTRIQFDLATRSNVTLDVFDILGRHVQSLVRQELAAGTYGVTFDAKENPSGIYYAVLRTDNRVETRKMILVR
jgi:hypothetical protein